MSVRCSVRPARYRVGRQIVNGSKSGPLRGVPLEIQEASVGAISEGIIGPFQSVRSGLKLLVSGHCRGTLLLRASPLHGHATRSRVRHANQLWPSADVDRAGMAVETP